MGDILINFSFSDDSNKHICEIQIVHGKIHTARKELSKHESYEWLRSATSVLEMRSKSSDAAFTENKQDTALNENEQDTGDT